MHLKSALTQCSLLQLLEHCLLLVTVEGNKLVLKHADTIASTEGLLAQAEQSCSFSPCI